MGGCRGEKGKGQEGRDGGDTTLSGVEQDSPRVLAYSPTPPATANSIVRFAPLLSDAVAFLAPVTVRPSALARRAAPIGVCRIVAGYYS